jgi:hypothetical protein
MDARRIIDERYFLLDVGGEGIEIIYRCCSPCSDWTSKFTQQSVFFLDIPTWCRFNNNKITK